MPTMSTLIEGACLSYFEAVDTIPRGWDLGLCMSFGVVGVQISDEVRIF
jgi:hypothetical protein